MPDVAVDAEDFHLPRGLTPDAASGANKDLGIETSSSTLRAPENFAAAAAVARRVLPSGTVSGAPISTSIQTVDDVATVQNTVKELRAKQSATTATQTPNDGKTTPPNPKDPKADSGGKDPEEASARASIYENLKSAGKNTAKFFGTTLGLAVLGAAIFLAITAASLDCTDGSTCTITNVSVIDNSNVRIDFNVQLLRASCAGLFNPCINDSVKMNADVPLYNSSGQPLFKSGCSYTITQVLNGMGTIVINSPSSTSGYTQRSSTSFGTFNVQSTFAAQCAQNMVAAASIPLDALDKLGQAAAKTFCDIVPFLCNTTLWIVLVVAIFLSSSASAAFFVIKQ